jgi:hypothetical protein
LFEQQLLELEIQVFAPIGGWRQVVEVCALYAEPTTRKQLEASIADHSAMTATPDINDFEEIAHL